MEKLIQHISFIGGGILLTLQLLIGGILIGLLFGALLAILRYNNIANTVINRFISIIRGTPLILQLSFVYFLAPIIIGIKLNILVAGILTFGLNSSAYIAEILRSGIESLSKGQFEAAKTLQIPNFYMWKDIILPQVARNILPAMINEVIGLLKETALISTIGGMDLLRRAQVIAAEQFTYFIPLCIAGCYYYGLVLLIEYTGKKLELRWNYAKHK
ncbi:Putative amino acid ABC transporter permease [Candidatus Trichorickettsia mobilis]|jgi:polar amino acid transport system permease protein|uniref:Putative glutamine transport system permease protein GlnP n=1 Tax=Candidatus Trichorickettsia mobilis TaxID=1346319 RepID=A0ABZ0UU38_9RICK|nr:amino acid ABC transporter permease [Candidatus Trichorickettsia mobilis]WPY00142.1 Putative amino acid ABC transporter permease [Candidatus Trichorickettsia mobilis]